MVSQTQFQRRHGFITVELIAALTILMGILIPIALSFAGEQKLCRAYYNQAIAMEIVDGEMEILKAGQWREFPDGQYATPVGGGAVPAKTYPVLANAISNLPPGQFTLTVQGHHFRLEWSPIDKGQGGRVIREMEVR